MWFFSSFFKICMCFTVLLNQSGVEGIWPPPYSINLSHEETFVISEPLEKSDVQDVYDEEEMIKKEDMEEMKIRDQREKFFRIHQHINRNEKPKKIDSQLKVSVPQEFNPDIEESLPWKGGFVDESGKFLPEKGMVYFDEDAKNDKELGMIKREDFEKDKVENYDYAHLKAEYDIEMKKVEKSNETLQYSTVKEEESVKESVKDLVDFKKTPRNCTKEETEGIGMAAVECFWMEVNKPQTNKYQFFEKALRIFIIWIVVYLIVAIPCWCQYGWCCCCCRCKFCNPKEQIDEVKRFSAEYPVGVFHDEDGNRITYKATTYEKYAHKKLMQELNRL